MSAVADATAASRLEAENVQLQVLCLFDSQKC